MFHKKIRNATRLTALLVIATLIGMPQTSQAQVEVQTANACPNQNDTVSLAGKFNVKLSFYQELPDRNMITSTEAITSHGWRSKTNYKGRLKISRGLVKPDLPTRVKVIGAYVSYGNISTPLYCNTQWDGKGSQPLARLLKASDGRKFVTPLSSLIVYAYDPKLPEPVPGPQK